MTASEGNSELILLPSAARTADGTSAVFEAQNATRVAVTLDVTAASGTSPTLDVKLQGKDPASGEWFDIATFTQATGVTTETVWVGGGADTEFLTRTFRVSYTIGGTSPSFTFSVGAALDGT